MALRARLCPVDGRSFVPATHNHVYCGRRCAGKARNDLRRHGHIRPYVCVPFECAQCGRPCVPGEDGIAPHASRFCGSGCKAVWHRRAKGVPPKPSATEIAQRQARDLILAQPSKRQQVAYRRALRDDPCAYCGGQGGSIDHIDPQAGGGADAWGNMAGACKRCNSTKAALPLLVALLWVPTATAYHRQRRLFF
jgi:HNH endonuclease